MIAGRLVADVGVNYEPHLRKVRATQSATLTNGELSVTVEVT